MPVFRSGRGQETLMPSRFLLALFFLTAFAPKTNGTQTFSLSPSVARAASVAHAVHVAGVAAAAAAVVPDWCHRCDSLFLPTLTSGVSRCSFLWGLLSSGGAWWPLVTDGCRKTSSRIPTVSMPAGARVGVWCAGRQLLFGAE